MKSFRIQGGKLLNGEAKISGSKNSALPILAATVLLDGESVIGNIPRLRDIETMLRMLNALGLRAEMRGGQKVHVSNKGHKVKHLVPYELVTKMRASFFVLGPILARSGYVKIPLPGGCAIGSRPVDIHLKGFEALNAKIAQHNGFVEVQAKKLIGAEINLSFPSVGATENLMMAAALAEGNSIIRNAACEPEISDLAGFLNQCGAKITGAGSSEIKIEGVPKLSGSPYEVIPDRIEAGTLLLACAMREGNRILLKSSKSQHLESLLSVLKAMGLEVSTDQDQIQVFRPGALKAVDIETLPYPGFPTDLQSQLMVACSLCEGTSVIRENLFENRFMHVDELRRLGADIVIKDHVAIIKGVKQLSGCPVRTTDLRAAAALFLAGLNASGETLVIDDGHLDRGYEKLDQKLIGLGAHIHVDQKRLDLN